MAGDHANENARIAEDIRIVCEMAVAFVVSLLYALVQLVLFAGVLWLYSGPLTLSVGTLSVTVPGHMVLVAVAYAIVASALITVVGHPLVKATDLRQAAEAQYRSRLVNIGAQAPAIALILARHRRFHPVVEDLDRHATDRRKRRHMTAQQRLKVLMMDEARKQMARVAEHQAEQPDDPVDAGLVLEGDDEASEVHLCLQTGRGLEAELVGPWSCIGPKRRHEALHLRVATPIAAFTDLAQQSGGRQIRECGQTLADIVHEGKEFAGPAHLTGALDR